MGRSALSPNSPRLHSILHLDRGLFSGLVRFTACRLTNVRSSPQCSEYLLNQLHFVSRTLRILAKSTQLYQNVVVLDPQHRNRLQLDFVIVRDPRFNMH
jgi:hypothetical protein